MDEALSWLAQQQENSERGISQFEMAVTESDHHIDEAKPQTRNQTASEKVNSLTHPGTPAIADRERALKQKNARNFDATEWSQTASNAPTPLSMTNDHAKEAMEQMNEIIKEENNLEHTLIPEFAQRKRSEPVLN